MYDNAGHGVDGPGTLQLEQIVSASQHEPVGGRLVPGKEMMNLGLA